MPLRVAGREPADWLRDLEREIPNHVNHVTRVGPEPLRWQYVENSVNVWKINEVVNSPYKDPYALGITYQLKQTVLNEQGTFTTAYGNGYVEVPIQPDGFPYLDDLNFFEGLSNNPPGD